MAQQQLLQKQKEQQMRQQHAALSSPALALGSSPAADQLLASQLAHLHATNQDPPVPACKAPDAYSHLEPHPLQQHQHLQLQRAQQLQQGQQPDDSGLQIWKQELSVYQQQQQQLQHQGHHHFPAHFLPQQPLPPTESQQQLLANDAGAFSVIGPLKAKSPHSPEADRPPAAQPPANEDLFEEDAELAVSASPQPTEASSVPKLSAAEILARERRTEPPAHIPTVVAVDPKAAAAVQPGAMASLGSLA